MIPHIFAQHPPGLTRAVTGAATPTPVSPPASAPPNDPPTIVQMINNMAANAERDDKTPWAPPVAGRATPSARARKRRAR